MGHKSVAVIERWLFNRGSNIGHHIASDLKQVAVIMRWLLYRVTTIHRFYCTCVHHKLCLCCICENLLISIVCRSARDLRWRKGSRERKV